MNRLGLLRGLSRGMQAFVLLDVLLVLVLVVLVVTLPRSGGVDGAQAVASTPAAGAQPTADPGDGEEDADGDTVAFTSPTGNIACEMSAAGVLCTIGSFTYAPPQVTGCEGETGHVVGLDAEGFGFRCEDDGVPQVERGSALPYGSTASAGGYRCASGTDGVTCTDAAGVGFRLARAQWNALP